jgi:peptidyl-prolyl cis-trans isomerase B (cyclophilin B)
MRHTIPSVLLSVLVGVSGSSGLQPQPAPAGAAGDQALKVEAIVESARVSPERLYYGFGRDIPVVVSAPEGAGELTIGLFKPGAAEAEERAPVTAGRVNLASVFPSIWKGATPVVRFAQLFTGDKPAGAPVVLQPLTNPRTATLDPQTRRVRFTDVPPTFSGLRAYVDQFVVLDTSEGPITIALRPDAAPNTAWNFRQLVAGGFYTDVIFHRVVPSLPNNGPAFVIQGGDPTGTGTGGPGFQIDLESSPLPHDFGVISMARSGDPNSGGSQFFLCLSRDGTAQLDGGYTTFGQTVAGAEAIMKIAATPLQEGPNNRPVEPPLIKRAMLVDAPPIGTGREPVTRPAPEPQPR